VRLRRANAVVGADAVAGPQRTEPGTPPSPNAQKIAGEGVSAATVAIDNAPFKGVLPLLISALKSASPVLGNPANRGKAIALTLDQFKYGQVRLGEQPRRRRSQGALRDLPRASVRGPLFQAAVANFNLFGGETRVDSKNPERGPPLIIAGDSDNTVPPAITVASYKIQAKNPGVTEIARIERRGHSLVIDHGWHEVAQTALDFVKRFV
jgi:non-heme chloroperoxidase